MAQVQIGNTRTAQQTDGAVLNAMFTELYANNRNIPALGNSAAGSVVLPAGYAISSIYYANTSGSEVTGGLKFGTTVGGSDVVASQAVAGGSIGAIVLSTINQKLFNKTADTTIYFDAVTSWNGATVDVIFTARKVF